MITRHEVDMNLVQKAFDELDQLCQAIKGFSEDGIQSSTYRASVIDHFHPADYCQRGVAGLSRFYSHCQSERDYVEGVSDPVYYSQGRVDGSLTDPDIEHPSDGLYDQHPKSISGMGRIRQLASTPALDFPNVGSGRSRASEVGRDC